MKVSELKNKIGLSKKWRGTKIKRKNNTEFVYDYLNSSIIIIQKQNKYKIMISMEKKHYPYKEFESLKNIRNYLEKEIQI